jgi:hypothetical protein
MESKLITIYVYEPNDKDLFEQHLDKAIALTPHCCHSSVKFWRIAIPRKRLSIQSLE